MSNVLTKPLSKGCNFVFLIFVGLFLLVFLDAVGGSFLLEIPFRMVCGWLFHVDRTVPPFLEKWRAAVLPLGCLAIAVWLTHSFICRWTKAKRPDLAWRIKYTVSIYSLLFLSSAAAIAMSGIVHQFFWLSKENVIERRSRGSDQAYAIIKARDICQFMNFYHQENGRYPKTWEELESWEDAYFKGFRYMYLGKVAESFILLDGSLDSEPHENKPLVVSPYIQAVDKYAIGFSNESPRLVDAVELKEILKKIKEPEPIIPNE